MRTRMIKLIGLGVVLMAWALLLVHTTVQAKLQTPDADQLIQNAPAQPQPPPAEAVIQPAVPAAAAVSIDLCATTGTLALPGGGSVDIWGFVLGSTCAPGDATLPGPVIRVNAGDVVTINLTNNLDDPTSILIAGQNVSSSGGSSGTFTTEASAGGGTASYSFTAQAGTYLYESGTDPSRQIPMGLYGALIVDTVPLSGSSSGQAYGSGTEFEAEAVLLLSEIDPNLNANPSGFNLLNYHPTHWLINGKGYPNTDPIVANPGERVLLRYLNAGFDYPSMTLLGAYQRVIAKEAFELANAFDVVAEIIPAGTTADMIVNTTGLDGSLPLYNRNMYVTNGNAYPGGMLTFMTFGAPPPGANLAITQSDAIDPVTVGDVVTYTVTVSNSGPDPAANVVMTDTLPAGVTYGSATPDQGSCSEVSGVVTCNLGNIANGGSVSAVVVVTTTAEGTIINTASVTSDTSDPNPANNSVFEDTTVNPVPVSGANLTISKTDNADPVTVGDNVIYTVTVSNSGPDPAANVVMTDTLPAEVNFVSASSGCTEAGSVVTCALSSIGSGADAVVTIEVTTTADGVITNNASVTSDTSDPNPTDNSTSEDTTVNSVYGVSIAPATDSQTDTPGTLVSYSLDVTNEGNGPDTFDVNVAGNTWSASAPTTVGPLAAGATAQIRS